MKTFDLITTAACGVGLLCYQAGWLGNWVIPAAAGVLIGNALFSVVMDDR